MGNSGPGNEEVFRIPQSSSILGASPSHSVKCHKQDIFVFVFPWRDHPSAEDTVMVFLDSSTGQAYPSVD